MIVTKEELQQMIDEEFEREMSKRRSRLSEDMFTPSGHMRAIHASNPKLWKMLNSDLNMVATAVEKAKEAALDQDEESAAKWVQNAQKYAKMAYETLLGGK